MGTADTNVRTVDLQSEVVLALNRSGRDELRQPQAGLSLPQRKLLTLIDGKRSLTEIAAAEPTLHAERVPGDAARLLGRGLVELEQGWLQPITRPTTVMPANALRPAPVTLPQESPLPPAARTAKAAARTTKPRRWAGTLWLALAAAGGVLIVVGILMQPAKRSSARAATPSVAPRPIVKAPALPVPDRVTDPSKRSAVIAGDAALARAAALGKPAQVALQNQAMPSSAAPLAAAKQSPAAAASPSVRDPAPNTTAAKVAAVLPPAVRPLEAPAAPEPALAAVANPAAPAAADASVASGTSEASAPKAATTAVAAAAPAPVPAWAREFAPVAPDANSARLAAAGSALSPIERVPPIYPREAVRQGIARGSIRVRAVLAANGSVERVEFPSIDAGNRVFERPARAALMTWTFPPGDRARVYEAVLDFVAP